MAYGFQVINTDGVVQVDQDYKNYALYSKTVLTGSFGGSSINTSDPLPVPSTGTYIIALQTNSTSYAARVYGSTIASYSTTASPPVVTAYVFAAPSTSAEAHGLRVFNSAGEVVFDSGLKYMRVVYAGYIPDISASGGGPPYTYSGLASGSYAFVQAFSRQLYSYSGGAPGSFTVFRDWYQSRSTGFEVRNGLFVSGPGSTTGFGNQLSGGPVMMIDVAGM